MKLKLITISLLSLKLLAPEQQYTLPSPDVLNAIIGQYTVWNSREIAKDYAFKHMTKSEFKQDWLKTRVGAVKENGRNWLEQNFLEDMHGVATDRSRLDAMISTIIAVSTPLL